MSKEKVKKSEDGAGGTRFPELCPSNSSIHPSCDTGLLKLPYDVVCRQRLIRKKRIFAAQINRELNNMIAMKTKAVDGIKLDLLFTVDD